MIFPKPPEKGSFIGITAPSSPVSPELLSGIRRFTESFGFKVKFGKSVRISQKGYSAGSAKDRAADINGMFKDKDIGAIWCVRGGHSGIQLLELLDYGAIRENPKPFIGFSDVTVLHAAINEKCSLVTFHGPMPWKEHEAGKSQNMKNLKDALFMKDRLLYSYPSSNPPVSLSGGTARGILTGGNLSLLCALSGTSYDISYDGKILFIEDEKEPVHKLERMLWQLKYAGVFKKVRGVLVGTFENCINPYLPSYGVLSLMRDFFSGYDKPVLANIRAGHCSDKFTLPLGAGCFMDTDKKELWFLR